MHKIFLNRDVEIYHLDSSRLLRTFEAGSIVEADYSRDILNPKLYHFWFRGFSVPVQLKVGDFTEL